MKRLITSFALAMLVMLGASGIANAQSLPTETLTPTLRTNAVESGQIVSVGGAGSIFNLVVQDSGLFNGNETVSYTSTATDTTSTVASGLANAINSDSQLQTLGVKAKAGTGGQYTITSSSTNATTYTESVGGTGGVNQLFIQETLSLGGTVHSGDVLTVTVHDAGLSGGQENVSVSGSSIATLVLGLKNAVNADTHLSGLGIKSTFGPNALTIVIESDTYDTAGHITSYIVSTTGSETMTLGDFFGTNGVQKITVGGTVTPGDVVAFFITNVTLTAAVEPVSYIVQSTDSLASISSGLAAAVNADTSLANIGVSATSASGVLSVNSNSEEFVGAVIYMTAVATTCRNVDGSSTTLANSTWPTGAYTQVCHFPGASEPTADANTMLTTLNGFASNNSIADAYGRILETAYLASTGDTISFDINDSRVGVDIAEVITYPVMPGDSLTTIARYLVNAINNNTTLHNDGISANIVSSNGKTIMFSVTEPATANSSGSSSSSIGPPGNETFSPSSQSGNATFTLSGGDPNDQIVTYIFNNVQELYASVYNPQLHLVRPAWLGASSSGCLAGVAELAGLDDSEPDSSSAGADGFGHLNKTTSVPCWVALFDTNINTNAKLTPGDSVQDIVAHEWGHVVSYVYAHDGVLSDTNLVGTSLQNGTTSAAYTQLWQHNVNAGLFLVNNYWPCLITVTGVPPNNSSFQQQGLFSGFQDRNGKYFCANDPTLGDGFGTMLSTSTLGYSDAFYDDNYAQAAFMASHHGQNPNGGLGVLALQEPAIFDKQKPNSFSFDPTAIAGEIFAQLFAFQSGNSYFQSGPLYVEDPVVNVFCATTVGARLFLDGTVYAGSYGYTYLGPTQSITYAQYTGNGLNNVGGTNLPSSGPSNLPFTSSMGNCPAQ